MTYCNTPQAIRERRHHKRRDHMLAAEASEVGRGRRHTRPIFRDNPICVNIAIHVRIHTCICIHIYTFKCI